MGSIDASTPDTWASCGAMYLTGDAEGPPLAIGWPEAKRLGTLATRFGVDTALLSERAAAGRLGRRGRLSCGGHTRLMRALDGWVSLSLARKDDLELMPAFLGVQISERDDPWAKVAPRIELEAASELDDRAGLLGICFSVVGTKTGAVRAEGSPRPGARVPEAPVVVDLSALWAGPLCAHLLGRAGARVLKVEDTGRPDGARAAVGGFFDLLNQDKLSVAIDFRAPSGRARLSQLLDAADVVLTSSRARAFDQLDIEVGEVLSTASDKVWTAITAYGWSSNRVGYGDDVAAGTGLVAWHPEDGEPRFAGDAIADPLCGLEAAAITLDCLARGGRWFVDASLAGAAVKAVASRESARPARFEDGRWVFEGLPVTQPRVRIASSRAHLLGSDTEKVLAEFGL